MLLYLIYSKMDFIANVLLFVLFVAGNRTDVNHLYL